MRLSRSIPSSLSQNDVYLSFSTLYWMTGIWALLGGTMRNATRIITTFDFDAELILAQIERYQVSVLLTPPAYLAQMLNSHSIAERDLSSLRQFLCGGCSVPTELVNKFKQVKSIDVRSAYGMTEVGGIVSVNMAPDHVGTVGMLKPGTTVKIVDEHGTNVGPLTDGEICVRVAYPLLGYWRDPVNTDASFSADGWYRSGDIGHFDDAGCLVLVDRVKDILFVPEHFAPSELENVVLKCCPGVADVCVVGIPDERNGVDLPAAVVIVAAGQSVRAETIEAVVNGK